MKRITAITTHYAGRKYRSRLEAKWAAFFDAAGIAFQYEMEGFVVRQGGYLPDFYLPPFRMFFEVKPHEPTEDEASKCAQLAIDAETDVLIAMGEPEPRFNLLWFTHPDGQVEDTFVLGRDRIVQCGFWLIAERGESRWIGPNLTGGAEWPRGPMLSGALDAAYRVALSQGFERGGGKVRQPVIVEPDADRHWMKGA